MSRNQSTYPIYVQADILEKLQLEAEKHNTTRAEFSNRALEQAIAFSENGVSPTEDRRAKSESLCAAFAKLLDAVLAKDTDAGNGDIPDSTFLYLINLQIDLNRGLWYRNAEALSVIRLYNSRRGERFIKLLEKQLEAYGVK